MLKTKNDIAVHNFKHHWDSFIFFFFKEEVSTFLVLFLNANVIQIGSAVSWAVCKMFMSVTSYISALKNRRK